MRKACIEIAGRRIGPDWPPYVVAELSGNHNGRIERALRLIDAAKDAGADAVKLQTYTADTITIDHDGPGFRIEGGTWDGRTLFELYEWAHTPWEWHEELFVHARTRGITIFSTPFDPSAVEFLERFDPPAYKIASFELIDLPLVERVAATGKPLILSTGMATLSEIKESVAAARGAGCDELVVLHCVSGYPTPVADSNLRTIADLARRIGVVVGLSDHTLGTAAPVAAVALGASVIEKHVTLHRTDGAPDAAFSLEPNELARLCRDCRAAWQALGRAGYDRKKSEEQSAMLRRSLYAVQDIAKGEVITNANVRSIRPGFGLPPKMLPHILGKRALRPIKRGEPLDRSMFETDGTSGRRARHMVE